MKETSDFVRFRIDYLLTVPACLANLNEEKESVPKINQGRIKPFRVEAKEIITLKLKF